MTKSLAHCWCRIARSSSQSIVLWGYEDRKGVYQKSGQKYYKCFGSTTHVSQPSVTRFQNLCHFISVKYCGLLSFSQPNLWVCHISDRSTMDQRCIVGTSIAFICSSWSGGQTKESGLGREKERPIASISRIGQKLPCTHSVRSWLREKAEKYDGDLVIRKKRWVFGQTHKIWDLVKKPPWAHSIRSQLREKTGKKIGKSRKTSNQKRIFMSTWKPQTWELTKQLFVDFWKNEEVSIQSGPNSSW